jgi:hypothetical protein
MSKLHFFEIAALAGDHRLRRELRAVWDALDPPSARHVEAHLRAKSGVDRDFTDEERAQARTHLMYLMAEDALRCRLGWDDDDLWGEETEAGLRSPTDTVVAYDRIRRAGPENVAERGAAHRTATETPELRLAAATKRANCRTGGSERLPLGFEVSDQEGNRFALTCDAESRVCIELAGAAAPVGVRLVAKTGEDSKVKVENCGDHLRLGPEFSLADAIEGAENGILSAIFLYGPHG